MLYNTIIIGSGPAGHTAMIYAGRAMLNPLMFEGFMAGGVPAGGQLTTTTEVENFPGFPTGIQGPELMEKMRQQSLNSGGKIITKTVDKIERQGKNFCLTVEEEKYITKTVIISTGATAKRLDLPNEDNFWQKGISACAVCDGALPIFRDQVLAVIGGGDSACEESSFLTKYTSKVYLLVRKDKMRASKIMQERVKKNPKIEILWNTSPIEVNGTNNLETLKIKNTQSNKVSDIKIKGLFYAIGHKANTDFLNGLIELNSTGYIITKSGTTQTNIKGIFACGDVQDQIYRQAITAAGSGCMAALEVEKYLS